jgi:hypothetical protein
VNTAQLRVICEQTTVKSSIRNIEWLITDSIRPCFHTKGNRISNRASSEHPQELYSKQCKDNRYESIASIAFIPASPFNHCHNYDEDMHKLQAHLDTEA